MSTLSFGFIGFLLLICILYYCLPGKSQWVFLLFASSLFYLTGGIKTAGFICVTILTVWISAQHVRKSRIWFILCLFVNFGILAFLKFRVAEGSGLLLPLGISYYTFQSMGYLMDVRKGKYPAEKSLPRFALFISFFPQLALGPISRYDQLKKELYTPHKRDAETIGSGAQRILWGYFKKLMIANRLSGAVAAIGQDPERFGGIYVLVGMLLYTAELYADFTGGADIAIGSAELFGIHLPENFKTPFFSRKLSRYWTSWHITLMNWFREYIFYPTAVCKPVRILSRKFRNRFGKKAGDRVSLWSASILVWLITGIWHGFNLRCVLWGLLNCIILLASHELEPLYTVFRNRFHTEGKKDMRFSAPSGHCFLSAVCRCLTIIKQRTCRSGCSGAC
jgi:alginate O-acetyltransferase complex protein AlgI